MRVCVSVDWSDGAVEESGSAGGGREDTAAAREMAWIKAKEQDAEREAQEEEEQYLAELSRKRGNVGGASRGANDRSPVSEAVTSGDGISGGVRGVISGDVISGDSGDVSEDGSTDGDDDDEMPPLEAHGTTVMTTCGDFLQHAAHEVAAAEGSTQEPLTDMQRKVAEIARKDAERKAKREAARAKKEADGRAAAGGGEGGGGGAKSVAEKAKDEWETKKKERAEEKETVAAEAKSRREARNAKKEATVAKAAADETMITNRRLKMLKSRPGGNDGRGYDSAITGQLKLRPEKDDVLYATIGSGNLRMAVALPHGMLALEWLGMNALDFHGR
jgi:hypothetical protein